MLLVQHSAGGKAHDTNDIFLVFKFNTSSVQPGRVHTLFAHLVACDLQRVPDSRRDGPQVARLSDEGVDGGNAVPVLARRHLHD